MTKSPMKIRYNKYFGIWTLITAIIGLFIGVIYFYLPYEVKIDDQIIGILNGKDKLYIDNALDEFTSNYKSILNKDIKISNNVEFNKLMYFKKANSKDKISLNIKNKIDFTTEGYCINVNGNDLAYLVDKEAADETIKMIKEIYIGNAVKDEITEVKFTEEVKVLQENISIYNIVTKQSAFKFLITGNEAFKEYLLEKPIIKENKNIINKYTLANNDLNLIDSRNLDISSRGISSNDSIIMQESNIIEKHDESEYLDNKPLLNLEVTKVIDKKEEIPFEIEYKDSNSLYKGDTKLISDGENGIKETKYSVTLLNGKEIKKEKLNEEIIKEPVNKILSKGTKEKPKETAYGVFSKPTTGIITSRFGPRNGGFHRGVDIASKIGTPVYAADGGTVFFAGYSGNYGKLIKIDHGNGYVTYYAHNNELLVSAGDKVYKGQLISKMGATGRVTGPHLHFEILKNGENQNPLNYIK